MPEEKGYQGWKNYETWAVALWFGNDRGSEEHWREQAQEIVDNLEDLAQDRYGQYADKRLDEDAEKIAAIFLADQMKDEVEEYNPLADAPEQHGMYADLLSAAISEVYWLEIAEHYMEDVEWPEDDDDED